MSSLPFFSGNKLRNSHLRSSHLRSNHSKTTNRQVKKDFFVHSIRMLNLSLNELKLITRGRGIKGYKSISEDRLLSALNASESVKKVTRIRMARNQYEKKIMMLIKQ